MANTYSTDSNSSNMHLHTIIPTTEGDDEKHHLDYKI